MNNSGNTRTLLATTRHLVQCNTRSYHHYQFTTLPGYRLRSPSSRPYLHAPQQIRARYISFEQQAKDLNQKGVDKQLHDYDAKIAEDKEKQRKAPWHREGSDRAPVNTNREAGAMTKGKLAPASTFQTHIDRFRKTAYHSFSTAEARFAPKYSRH